MLFKKSNHKVRLFWNLGTPSQRRVGSWCLATLIRTLSIYTRGESPWNQQEENETSSETGKLSDSPSGVSPYLCSVLNLWDIERVYLFLKKSFRDASARVYLFLWRSPFAPLGSGNYKPTRQQSPLTEAEFDWKINKLNFPCGCTWVFPTCEGTIAFLLVKWSEISHSWWAWLTPRSSPIGPALHVPCQPGRECERYNLYTGATYLGVKST